MSLIKPDNFTTPSNIQNELSSGSSVGTSGYDSTSRRAVTVLSPDPLLPSQLNRIKFKLTIIDYALPTPSEPDKPKVKLEIIDVDSSCEPSHEDDDSIVKQLFPETLKKAPESENVSPPKKTPTDVNGEGIQDNVQINSNVQKSGIPQADFIKNFGEFFYRKYSLGDFIPNDRTNHLAVYREKCPTIADFWGGITNIFYDYLEFDSEALKNIEYRKLAEAFSDVDKRPKTNFEISMLKAISFVGLKGPLVTTKVREVIVNNGLRLVLDNAIEKAKSEKGAEESTLAIFLRKNKINADEARKFGDDFLNVSLSNSDVYIQQTVVRQMALPINGITALMNKPEYENLNDLVVQKRLDCQLEGLIAEFSKVVPSIVYNLDFLGHLCIEYSNFKSLKNKERIPGVPIFCRNMSVLKPAAETENYKILAHYGAVLCNLSQALKDPSCILQQLCTMEKSEAARIALFNEVRSRSNAKKEIIQSQERDNAKI